MSKGWPIWESAKAREARAKGRAGYLSSGIMSGSLRTGSSVEGESNMMVHELSSLRGSSKLMR